MFATKSILTDVEIGLWTIGQVRDYAHSLKERLNQRFHFLHTDDILKGIKLLDTCLWPKHRDAPIKLWKGISSVQKRC